MEMHENAHIFIENVHISLHFHENAQKCAHFERPLPARVFFWFPYYRLSIEKGFRWGVPHVQLSLHALELWGSKPQIITWNIDIQNRKRALKRQW